MVDDQCIMAEAKLMSHFVIYKDKAGEHRFKIIADNGKIVGPTESFASDYNAERGILDMIHAVRGASTVTAAADGGEETTVRIRREDEHPQTGS